MLLLVGGGIAAITLSQPNYSYGCFVVGVVVVVGLWQLCKLGSYVTQTILPGLWPRLVRLGWHIIYNSATQPEVSIQPITQDGFMGWPCKEAQSGSIVTIYTCMGLPTMYNSVSSGAILALRHFRYSRISAEIILPADVIGLVYRQQSYLTVPHIVV